MAGRVFFITEWVEDGRVIQETMFAYTIDIELDRAAFEGFFPTAPATSADRQPHTEGGSKSAVRKLYGKEWVPEAYKRRPDELLAMGITGASERTRARKSEAAPDCAKPLKARYIEKLLRDLGTFEKADQSCRSPEIADAPRRTFRDVGGRLDCDRAQHRGDPTRSAPLRHRHH